MNKGDLQTDDGKLGEIVDEVLSKMAGGEAVDVEQYAREHPDVADVLRHALPALRAVAQSSAGGSGSPTIHRSPSGETNESLSANAALGDFRIVQELGRGGMGVVYEAEQISMGRRVALKVLPFAGMVRGNALQRFHNEVRAAAALDHPNIVSVYSVGEERGVHYYAMQLIRGQTLADVIGQLAVQQRSGMALTADSISDVLSSAEKKLPSSAAEPTEDLSKGSTDRPTQPTRPVGKASEATIRNAGHDRQFYRSIATLVSQAADALEHAHQNGVIHRDIKPGNLMLDADSLAYVTDFGLARIECDAAMTMTGDLIGTLRYMSPEQALAKRVVIDHRSDIYSLGVTLYELLTLQPAFATSDRQELLKQIAFEEPTKLRKLNRAIPSELETIVLKSIEKNPDDRYASAAAMAEDLQAFLHDRPIKARPASALHITGKWMRRHRAITVTLAASCLLLVASVFSVMWWSRNEQATLRKQAENRAEEAMLAQKQARRSAADAEAAHAKEAAARANAEGYAEDLERQRRQARQNLYNADIRLAAYDLAAGNTKRLLATLTDHLPLQGDEDRRGWEWYYLLANCRQQQSVLPQHWANVAGVAWSPDGSMIASVSYDGNACVSDARTRHVIRIFLGSTVFKRGVDWSPDGTKLAWGSVGDEMAIRIWDVETDDVKILHGHEASLMQVAWSPDGKRLASGSQDRTLRIWDPQTGECLQTIQPDSDRFVDDAQWSGDATLIAIASRQAGGHEVRNVHEGRVIAELPEKCWTIAWSPDDTRLALGSREGECVILETTQWTTKHRFRAHDGSVYSVAWNHDGSLLATGGADGLIHIWSADGKLERTLRGHRGSVQTVSWHPARPLLVSGGNDTDLLIWNLAEKTAAYELEFDSWLQDLTWSNIRYLTCMNGSERVELDWKTGVAMHRKALAERRNALWTPDGGKYLFRWTAGGNVHEIKSTETGETLGTIPATNSQRKLWKWSPDGSKIAFSERSSYDDQHVQVWSVLEGRMILSDGPITDIQDAAWSPDGRHLAVAASGEISDGGNLRLASHVYVIDTEQKQRRNKFRLDEERISASGVAWSQDGSRVVASSNSGVTRAWDLQSGETLFKTQAANAKINALDWSPDGHRIALAAEDNQVHIIDAGNGRELLVLAVRQPLHDLVWSPDGNALAGARGRDTEAEQSRIYIWDASSVFENPIVEGQLHYAAGREQHLIGNDESAIDRFSRAIELNPLDWRALLFRARAQSRMPDCRQTDLERVIADATRSIEIRPLNSRALSERSYAYWRTGDLTSAIRDATQLAEHDNFAILRYRAGLFAESGTLEEALDDYIRANERSPSASGQYFEILCRVAVDRPPSAGYLEKLESMWQQYKDASEQDQYWTVWTVALLAGTFDESVGEYDRYIELCKEKLVPDHLDTNTTIRFATLGALLHRAGRHDEAVKQLKEVTDSWDETPAASAGTFYTWSFLAMAEQKLGHEQRAREALSEANQQAQELLRAEVIPWYHRFPFEFVRDEANSLINPAFPADEE